MLSTGDHDSKMFSLKRKKSSIYITEKRSHTPLLEIIGYGPTVNGIAIEVELSTNTLIRLIYSTCSGECTWWSYFTVPLKG